MDEVRASSLPAETIRYAILDPGLLRLELSPGFAARTRASDDPASQQLKRVTSAARRRAEVLLSAQNTSLLSIMTVIVESCQVLTFSALSGEQA